MENLVSIIVPVYNETRYLGDCVKSIINQTYNNIEVILVDDGSINEAADICENFAEMDKRVKVIHQVNQGLSAARITGLQMAEGDWIMFVDNDDIISPIIVELLLKMSKNKEIDIIAGQRINLVRVDKFQWDIRLVSESIVEEGMNICKKIGKDQQKYIITPIWGKLYRKSFLNEIEVEKYRGICPTIFFEDVLMTPILYAKAKKICIVDRIIYAHREVSTSISRSGKLGKFYYEQIESGNILLQFYKYNNIYEMYTYELELYMRTILRIWCLMDKQLVDKNIKDYYRIKIKYYYKKYIWEYIRYGDGGLKNRIIYGGFAVFKPGWTFLVNHLFYLKRD